MHCPDITNGDNANHSSWLCYVCPPVYEGWRFINAVDSNRLSQHFIAKLTPSPFPAPVKNTMATETRSHFPTQPTHFHGKISSCWSGYWWLMSYKKMIQFARERRGLEREVRREAEGRETESGGVKGRLTSLMVQNERLSPWPARSLPGPFYVFSTHRCFIGTSQRRLPASQRSHNKRRPRSFSSLGRVEAQKENSLLRANRESLRTHKQHPKFCEMKVLLFY